MAVIFILCFLSACTDKTEKTSDKTSLYAISKHALERKVFYAGTIQPLKTTVVTSPVEGVIEEMRFHYGDEIKAKEPLFTIYSDKFLNDYKTALMQYIKAKTELNNTRMQLSEGKFLHKNQLISDDEFKAKETSFYTAQLTLIQAEDQLNAMLKQMDIKGFDFHTLKIENIDKINQALHGDAHFQKIQIFSPIAGVALIPIKNETQETTTKKVSKGDGVKLGDLLLMIGDVSGYMIHIHVNEFNVNELKIGQKVKVTGNAFSEYPLEGEIASIDHQGQIGPGGVPLFPVEIIIPHVTEKERQVIHVGMSAKVEISIVGDAVITVPIAAIFEKKGLSYVTIKKGNRPIDIPVKTGPTTADAVQIDSSLEVGDQVFIRPLILS